MELIKRELPKDYKLGIVSDLHCGSMLFKEALFKKYVVEQIKADPNYYFVLNGDVIEGIIQNDKRFNRSAIDHRFSSPQDEIAYVEEMVSPVKEQLLGGCLGNHEASNVATFNAFKQLCKNLKIPYGGGIYKLIATNGGKVMHKYLMCHGKWLLPKGAKDPIQREANRKAAQKRILESLGHADCIVSACGHHHHRLIVEPTVQNHLYLTDDGKKIKAKQRVHSNQAAEYIPTEARWFVGSGSYRGNLCDPGSGAIDYAELYEPADLGHVIVHVNDGEVTGITEVRA